MVTGAETGRGWGTGRGKGTGGGPILTDIDIDVGADADTRREQDHRDPSRSQAHMSFIHPPLSKRLLQHEQVCTVCVTKMMVFDVDGV